MLTGDISKKKKITPNSTYLDHYTVNTNKCLNTVFLNKSPLHSPSTTVPCIYTILSVANTAPPSSASSYVASQITCCLPML